MTLRNIWTFLAVVLAPFCLSAGCASAQDASAERIVAIGDLHGDYDAFEALLKEADLIDKRGKWAGGETILVQTGDVPDRGPDSLKIIKHLQKLQEQASRKGGRVVTLVGNHEAMNLTGDLRYVHPGEYEAFKTRNSEKVRGLTYETNRESLEAFYLEQDPALSSNEIREKWFAETPLGKLEHQAAWRPDGDVGEWISGNPAVAIIGDSLFVHGGISSKYAAFSVEEMNMMTAGALSARSVDRASIINDELGPLWYRGNVREAESDEAPPGADDAPAAEPLLTQEEEIDLALDAFGVSRIIVGHTPALEGITPSYGGKIVQIDTGISEYYGGTQSFLEIRDGVLYAHDNGAVTVLDGAPEGNMQ